MLDERWADKRDRDLFSDEQIRVFGDYLQQLALRDVECLAPAFRRQVEHRIDELERFIEPEVVAILRARGSDSKPSH